MVTKETERSMKNTSEAEIQKKKEKAKHDKLLKNAKRATSWVIGIAASFLPVMLAVIGKLSHLDNANEVAQYDKFISAFFNDGEFLWVSISLLLIADVDLLLFGFKKKISGFKKFFCIIFIILSLVLAVAALIVYFDNIASPVNSTSMQWWSRISFVVFAVSSAIVSFKIKQEG